MNTQDQLHCARNASAKWESRKSQKSISSGDKEEKEPAAVDKLLDIIRELVNDCMEERGE